ncbi:hypothetical protein DXG03_005150 [Asterophora parasitica]|uniref:HNH nuclease domain-containing protein n=1 Tax=Asterophora parasitica TaxID=117018 RepID=A0A9P7KDY7_9AGAR|nr:hypothetical protein DXG03_005150 [Asterophora parasitica]
MSDPIEPIPVPLKKKIFPVCEGRLGLYPYPNPALEEAFARQGIMLLPGRYEYRDSGKRQYSLCPTFRHWTPPEGGAPKAWRRGRKDDSDRDLKVTKSTASQAAKQADKDRCAITGEQDRTEAVHLIPASEGPWLARQCTYCEIELPKRLRGAYLYARFAFNIFQLATSVFEEEHPLEFVRLPKNFPAASRDQFEGEGNGDGGGGKGGYQLRGSRKGTKRKAPEQMTSQVKSTRYDDAPIDDAYDLYDINPDTLAHMRKIDDELQNADEHRHADPYCGFSRYEELAYKYRLEHPAATDLGSAWIALVTEKYSRRAPSPLYS